LIFQPSEERGGGGKNWTCNGEGGQGGTIRRGYLSRCFTGKRGPTGTRPACKKWKASFDEAGTQYSFWVAKKTGGQSTDPRSAFRKVKRPATAQLNEGGDLPLGQGKYSRWVEGN